MKAVHISCAIAVMFITVPTRTHGADNAAPNAVRTVLEFHLTPNTCDGKLLSDLQSSYYSDGAAFERDLKTILAACKVSVAVGTDLVILFTASPTLGAEAPSVVRSIYRHVATDTWQRVGGMLGALSATWILLTDDTCDSVKGEILSSRVEHPALAEVGPFASKLIGALPIHVHTIVGVAPPEPCVLDSRVRVYEATAPLIYRRGTINETVYIQRIHRTKDRQKFLTPKDVETTDIAQAAWVQLAEESAFANTPLTRFTFNAGAAILTGPVWGAKRMSIDSGKFVSDPIPRAATLVGITWHAKFDSTTAEPTPAEKHGFFTGGVLTPSAGLVAGYTYGWRGVSLLGGFGVIWVKSADSNERINTEVGEKEELSLRPAYGFLFGGSYAFGS